MKIQSDVFELRVMRTMLSGTGFSRKRGEIVLLYSCSLRHFLVSEAKEIQEWSEEVSDSHVAFTMHLLLFHQNRQFRTDFGIGGIW
ncbi:hypothetical protein VIGAN_04087700 [Vigna angularis var. angularis]|uniref:Uncharacterized protein n=1 Tax=Vigna angularis var. angularis TaxID=157739 RepID=A0A0S3RSW2_PHAAN|nr:hypothetical protein VIGAN_04087700 [Vigna angularis var. angularis]